MYISMYPAILVVVDVVIELEEGRFLLSFASANDRPAFALNIAALTDMSAIVDDHDMWQQNSAGQQMSFCVNIWQFLNHLHRHFTRRQKHIYFPQFVALFVVHS